MEYYRLSTIINPFSKEETEQDYRRAVKSYEAIGLIEPLKLDKNLSLLEKPGDYVLAMEQGKKSMPGYRYRVYPQNPDFLTGFSIEITTHCNSKCRICTRNFKTRPDVDLSFEDFKKIIDQTKGHHIIELYLYRLGEPFLNPELPRMLQYLKKFDNIDYIWISSNGLEFSEDHMKLLLDSNVTILNMSINAVNAEDYDKMNAVDSANSKFEVIKSNFYNAIKLKEKSGKRTPFMRAQMISHDNNKGKESQFIEEWENYADIINIGALEFGSKIEFNKQSALNRKIDESIKICRKPSRALFYLYNDGSTVPCMDDYNAEYLNMGNWREQTLVEILNSPKYKEFVRMHEEGKRSEIEFCADCLSYDL